MLSSARLLSKTRFIASTQPARLLFLPSPRYSMSNHQQHNNNNHDHQRYLCGGVHSSVKFYSQHLGRYRPLNYTDIFPDYRGDRPDVTITIEYDYPAYLTASTGIALTPTQVQRTPKLKIHSSKQTANKKYFTVLMVDPDAPSRDNPVNAEWNHWTVINIPNHNGEAKSEEGEEVVGYVGAGPPKDTGLHRYVFCVFAHDHRIVLSPPDVKIAANHTKGRAKFSAKKFAQRYNLELPVVMDSFQAEWDEYVPKLYSTFSDN